MGRLLAAALLVLTGVIAAYAQFPAVHSAAPGASGDFLCNESGVIGACAGTGNITRKTTPPGLVAKGGVFADQFNAGTCNTSITINWQNGAWQKVTLTNGATCAITFSNPDNGGNYLLSTVQGSSGNSLITWSSSPLWPGGSPPVLTATNAAKDIVSLRYDGTNYFGIWSLDFR